MTKKPYGALIIHGFTASLDCVRDIEPPIKSLGLPTRMPVLRGHGAESPEALRGVTWHDWMFDAESALKDLLTEGEKAILIGHSLGGLLTILLAAEHGDQIDSIVLAATAIQLRTPLGPGRPLSFLAPLIGLVFKKWDFAPAYADPSLAVYNSNYRWAPTDAILSLFDLSRVARSHLADVKTPTLILQSHNDLSVAPASANIIDHGISTPDAQKRIAWFEKSGHEMFRDCEREATVDIIAEYVRERIGAA